MSDEVIDLTENQIPENEVTERRSRLAFLRRGGGRVAIQGAVEPVGVDTLEIIEATDVLFGLEDQLHEYDELWDKHQDVISDALADDKQVSLFQQLMSGLANNPNAPKDLRQGTQRLVANGYPRFASVFIATGRLDASCPIIARRSALNSGRVLQGVSEEKSELRRVLSKRGGLLGSNNIHDDSPVLGQVNKYFYELEERSKNTYKPIAKLEDAMGKKILKQLDDDPQAAERLISIFILHSQSEVEAERLFARFLANRSDQLGPDSELAQAMAILEAHSASGGLAANFIKGKLKENDGDNVLAYFAGKLAPSVQSFIREMSETFGDWPADYREEYAKFATLHLKQYVVEMHRSVDRAKFKPWLAPDRASVEDAIDHLWHMIYRRYADTGMNRREAQQKGRVASKSKQNVEDLLQIEEKDSEPIVREVRALVRSNGGFKAVQAMDIDDIIKEHLGKAVDPNHARAIKSAIDVLRVKPFQSRGVEPVAKTRDVISVQVDNKRLRVYRANPARLVGIPTSRSSKEVRIVFTTDNQQLGILKLFTDHNDYEQYLRSLM